MNKCPNCGRELIKEEHIDWVGINIWCFCPCCKIKIFYGFEE